MPVTEIIANKTTWDLFQDCLDIVNAPLADKLFV